MQEEREGGLGAAAERMRDILGLESHPVAVKFLTEVPNLPGFQRALKGRYCQVLMRSTERPSCIGYASR
jgi:uncharacterized protein (DUF169 family)